MVIEEVPLEAITEDTFIKFFRKVTVEDGYQEAATASPDDLLKDFLSVRFSDFLIIPPFHNLLLFDEGIRSRLKRYTLSLNEQGIVDQKDTQSSAWHDSFVKFFNPEVLYSSFASYEKEENLLVLSRGSLNEEEKSRLIKRGEKWLEVLYLIEARKENRLWEWRLSNDVESIVAKVNPSIERPFIHEGIILSYDPGDREMGTLPGMTVDGFNRPPWEGYDKINLINVNDQSLFGHLIGKRVRYHYVDFVRSYTAIPYGELISVKE